MRTEPRAPFTRPLGLAAAVALIAASSVALATSASASTTADLFAPHENTTAEGFSSYGSCPDLEEGQDGWHFVLRGNSTTFVSLTGSFDSDGDGTADITVSAPGPAGTIGPPTAKHAYLYTEAGWTLIDATAQVNGPEIIFNLSHTCPGDGGGDPLLAPEVRKEAASRYTSTYGWNVDKNVDDSFVTSMGTTHTANYTIDVTRSGPVNSDFEVFGLITITNPNSEASGVVQTITGVTDDLHEDGSAVCEPNPLFAVPFDLDPLDSVSVEYVCTLPNSTSTTASGTNSATVSWSVGDETKPNQVSNDAVWDFAEATVTTVNATASLSDSLAGDLGTFSGSDTVIYSLDFDVPARNCVTYDNTATLTFDTGTDTGSASVQICRPNNDGGFTIGYWQNRNGQAFVKNNTASVKAAIDARYNKSTAPLLPAPSTSNALAKWVYDTVTAPVAGKPIAMFDKQYLATVLSTVKSPDLLDVCIQVGPHGVSSVEDLLLDVKADYATLVADPVHREGVKDIFDDLNNNRRPLYECP